MESLWVYALFVFSFVTVAVYAVLWRQKTKLAEGGDEPVLFQSSWAGYYGSRYAREGESPLKGAGAVTFFDRIKRFAGGLTSKRVPAETETLYFVLQFLMYMESGMTIMSALQKTQTSMEAAEYRLADELRKINFKLRGGVPFGEAVKVLDKEQGKELREFFLVISQAQQIGVPVSDALKGAIKEFEERRVIRAEERASRLSVMMAIPIVLGFLPSILLLVAMPAVHRLLEAFS